VFWPGASAAQPLAGPFDLTSAIIAAIAVVLLITRRLEVIPIVALSGLAGWLLWAAGLQAAT
jgi:hypothetical protein